ncbi:MAG: hypothetical protein ABW252_12710 [Polyangiales bacterium]
MADELHSFVRAIEVWRPDGDLLQRDSGAYGALSAFEDASIELTLKKGQGLPGAAWDTMRPEVWHDLGPQFLRTQAAKEVGIGAAVAIPFFRRNELVSIVAFYCGHRNHSEGCIEVWESNGKGELEHADGYYGGLAKFEEVSRQLKFSRGVGLPGQVFQHGLPRIIDDAKKSNSFIRAAAARESGVESGLGLPIWCGDVIQQVIVFLSAASTPLARAFEIWVPDAGGQLVLGQAFYAPDLARFGKARAELVVAPGEDLPGRVFATGLPFAVSTETRAYPQLNRAREAGIELSVAMPIHDGRTLRAVVVMFI